MNRKALVVLALIVLTLASFAPAITRAEGPYVIELPWDDRPTHEISTSDSVVLYTYWSYCRAPGMTNLFMSAFSVEATLDGQTLLDGSAQAAKPYWGEPWQTTDASIWCNANEAPEYAMEWAYEIGQLTSGVHTLEITVGLNHQVTDLLDFYGEGHPSKYGPLSITWTTTLNVTS